MRARLRLRAIRARAARDGIRNCARTRRARVTAEPDQYVLSTSRIVVSDAPRRLPPSVAFFPSTQVFMSPQSFRCPNFSGGRPRCSSWKNWRTRDWFVAHRVRQDGRRGAWVLRGASHPHRSSASRNRSSSAAISRAASNLRTSSARSAAASSCCNVSRRLASSRAPPHQTHVRLLRQERGASSGEGWPKGLEGFWLRGRAPDGANASKRGSSGVLGTGRLGSGEGRAGALSVGNTALLSLSAQI